MKYLGVDYGQKKVGFAIGNDISNTATPLDTFHYETHSQLFLKIQSLITKWNIRCIVVGDPGPQPTNEIYESDFKEIVSLLNQSLNIPIVLHNEYLSSQEAQSRIQQGEKGTKDSIAAQIILESYLIYQDNFKLKE